MADLYDPDFGTAFYRSKDPIKNLKIRVNFERVTSATILPQAALEKGTEGNVELQELQKNFAGQKDAEDYVFSWQEKIFCQREVDMYQDETMCETVLERKYHENTEPYRNGTSRPTKRLFSYVDHDAFTNRDENTRIMTTSPNEQPTVLAENMSKLRHRKVLSRDDRLIPKNNIVDYGPSEEAKRRNHFLSAPMQTMYIMADTSPASRASTPEDEQVLCTIKFDVNGVISVRPDFNKGRKAYRIESLGLGRDVYEYTIEHMSQQMSRQESDRELKMVRELYTRHTEYLSSLVGVEFEPMPPSEALRILVYGEILSAQDFEYNDLYVHYFVDIPQYWSPMSGQLSGMTQICSSKVIGRENVAYFSFPFNFEMVYRNDSIDEEKKKEHLPQWPMVYFEVLSLDSWERYRTEGYGYMSLPTKPGMSEHQIHCWRPEGRSVAGELRRFFIGGTPELEDPTYTALPSTFEGKNLSKFGFTTVSTGTLNIKLNILHQSQAFLRSVSSKKKAGTVIDRLGASKAQANILSVMEAFQRAKQRMILAREGLKKEFIETLKAYDTADDSD